MQPPPNAGHYFVGWAGKCRDRLDAIAPLFVKIEPTIWATERFLQINSEDWGYGPTM
jgi:hypothetical protein